MPRGFNKIRLNVYGLPRSLYERPRSSYVIPMRNTNKGYMGYQGALWSTETPLWNNYLDGPMEYREAVIEYQKSLWKCSGCFEDVVGIIFGIRFL